MDNKKDNDQGKPSGWNTVSGLLGQPRVEVPGGFKTAKCPGCQ